MHVPINFNNILANIQSINLYICALINNQLLRSIIKLKLISCIKSKKSSFIKQIIRV